MRYRILCAGLLASVAAGGAAVAADYAVRPASPPPPPVPVAAPAFISEWAGFYVGIHGGGGSAHTSFDPGFVTNMVQGTGFAPFDTNASGGIFGFQFGHNWQFGPAVGGVEIDFTGADLNETNTFTFVDNNNNLHLDSAEHRINELASARFRLGYLIFPNWLLYGTAGIGWGHSRLTTTDNVANVLFSSERSEVNEFGWVAGAGVEYNFGGHWLLRGEWLHYDFGRNNEFDVVPIVATGFMATPDTVRTTVDIGRAAISYKF